MIENITYEEDTQYCCEAMKRSLEDGRVMIGYSPSFRRYYIPLSWPHQSTQGINYCPWCGTKLPKPLINEWHEILEKEYGITSFHTSPDYPNEFDTDEWWIKRGIK